ncbi:redoxin domain-containing protein [Exiguobacterium sp. SH5S13]|uniref:TlpA family protein disulfide reductase n=1 Tax=unclassified Exiguobacterium TaxID=2644629 RepID=UPI001039BD2F|nr:MULTISPECIES: TlpA disulfide reductase family protein [unclassified Exiguobacterium]TCI24259.1 redoxin domain-containing protein [Exiguobacterium sp. SH5S4]TCI53581.1 redoxin domain-containing protein [Exiguobacterium sp. SH5S13]
MIAIGPLNVRLDLLVFMVSLLGLYIGFKKIGLTEKDRDAVLGTWFAGFLAWKLSAIIIGLASTGSLALSLYATGGIWSILIATATIGFFVFRLAPGLRGYWLFSALLLWFGVTIVVPKYGTLPFIATAQPLHLYTALLIAGLIVVTWRWMRSPSVGALLWTTVGAFAIWLVSTYATTTVNLLWLIPFAALVGLAGYVAKPSRRIVQSGLGVLVTLAIINASLPDETPTLVADSSQAAGLNIGQVPPNFELKRTDGTTLNLEDLRGERVVVNFWASWCPPCRAEMPDMAKFAREQDDVTIVAVNTTTSERDVDEARSFVAPYEDAFQVVYDEDGAVGNAYRIQAMPTTYVLDENGVIVAKQFGAIDKAWLDTKTN